MVDIEGGFKTVLVRNEAGQPLRVEIEDEAGFAGIDPTDEQIAATVVAELGAPKTTAELGRLASIAVNTRIYHDDLVADGESVIAGFADGILGRRYRDEVLAGKQVDLGIGSPWLDVLRTTDTLETTSGAEALNG